MADGLIVLFLAALLSFVIQSLLFFPPLRWDTLEVWSPLDVDMCSHPHSMLGAGTRHKMSSVLARAVAVAATSAARCRPRAALLTSPAPLLPGGLPRPTRLQAWPRTGSYPRRLNLCRLIPEPLNLPQRNS